MKSAFAFDDVRTLNIFSIRNSSNVLNVSLSNANSWENACSTSNFIRIKQTASKTIMKKPFR